MIEETYEVYAELAVFSEVLSLDELSTTLGVDGDRGWTRGELQPHTTLRRDENAWIVRSRLPRDAPLEDHVRDVLERITPLKQRLKELSKEADIEFCCIVYASECPALNFPRGVIAAISEVGASLDIDLYLVPRNTFFRRCVSMAGVCKRKMWQVFIR